MCEIYSDVDGVYTANPAVVAGARKLHTISYEEMLEMAASGAQVLALRSVEYARRYNVVIHSRSSFSDAEGTWVKEEDASMEQAIVSGVTYTTDEAKVTVRGLPDRPGVAAEVFSALADAHVNVDMIIQNVGERGLSDISCTVPIDDLPSAREALDRIVAELGAKGYAADDTMAKLSLIGAGMRSHPGVAALMFRTLADKGINLEMISTSPIKVSCVIAKDRVEEAVRALHDAFDLESAAVSHERTDRGWSMTDRAYTVAIVGATGVVGGTVRAILEERAFPVGELRLLASERSRGAQLAFRGASCTVGELSAGAFAGVDLAFFAAGGAVSQEFVPQAVAAGAVVIDKSSAFRADPAVPLVVPEVNADHLARHQGVIATPNCSTIQMVVALKPLHDAAGVERVVVSTYQSVSGSGKRGVDDLDRQARAWATGADPELSFYPQRIAFNLLPHIDSFLLATARPKKSRRWSTRRSRSSPTRGSESPRPACGCRCSGLTPRRSTCRRASRSAPPPRASCSRRRPASRSSTILCHGRYPTPLDAEGKDPVFVGRIRDDDTAANCLNFWVVADNLRKGAALNAVQIAETLVERSLL